MGKSPPTHKLSSSNPLPQPFHAGGRWVPHPGAHHFAPLLQPCSIPGGPCYGVLPIATVRQSPLVSSLKPLCCCCFSAVPLALEIDGKGTLLSLWPQQLPLNPLTSTEYLHQEVFPISFPSPPEALLRRGQWRQ